MMEQQPVSDLSRKLEMQSQAPNLTQVSRSLRALLEVLGEFRQSYGLSTDEALIFLALGQLSLSPSGAAFRSKPVTCSNLTEVLKIPRETVRRKAVHLVESELVSVGPRGFGVRNQEEWCSLVHKLVNAVIQH